MYDRKTIILYIVQVVSLTHIQHDDDNDDEIKYLIMRTNNLNGFLFPSPYLSKEVLMTVSYRPKLRLKTSQHFPSP